MGSELPLPVQATILSVLTAEPMVEKVILYGSRAKGTARPNSDIDLCLGGSGLDWARLAKLEAQLDDLPIPWKIDLSTWEGIDNADLKDHITRVGVLWWKRG